MPGSVLALNGDTAYRVPARLVQSETLGTRQVARASPSLPVPVPLGLHPSGSSSLPVPISLVLHLFRSPSPSISISPGSPSPLHLAESDRGCSPDPLGAQRPRSLGAQSRRRPPRPRVPRAPLNAPCTPVPAGSACCSRHRVGPGSGGSACARGPSSLAGGAKTHCGSRAPSR